MGTTLTGLTPATTYDALIKVGDNGPLSATAKRLSDGLGNDSVVALSTSSVGIGTTSPTQLLHVAGNVRITGAFYDSGNAAGTSGQILSSTGTGTDWVSKSDLSLVDGSGTANYVSKWSDTDTLTNSLIYDNGTNVGIGTTSPVYKLQINASGGNGISLLGDVNNEASVLFGDSGSAVIGRLTYSNIDDSMRIFTNGSERVRIDSSGNVGIGTATPNSKLNVVGDGATNGLTVKSAGNSGTFPFRVTWASGTDGSMFAIDDNGNVGIGTSSPDSKLRIQNDNATVPSLTIRDGGTPTADHIRVSSGTYGDAFFVKATGNVGIGTSSPAELLHLSTTLAGSTGVGTAIQITSGGAGGDQAFIGVNKGAGNGLEISVENRDIIFNTGATTPFGGTERMRLDSSGNLSITTGNIALSAAGGIYFDSGASKYLDDYEVGTWTMGISFGGGSTGITYNHRTGTYTKIGRQVTVNGLLALSSKGSSTGDARITGLPFTIPNAVANYAAPSLMFFNIGFANQFQAYGVINTTTIALFEITEAGAATGLTNADFANNSEIIISFTYQV